jgi:uncharacterized protein CbrC (UPF0167 family)
VKFKYFKNPKAFAVFTEKRVNCDICQKKERCYDGNAFYGEEILEGVCHQCLIRGKLEGTGIFANDADVEALFDQMIRLNPDTPKEELLQLAKAKIAEIELQTPPVLSWDDWQFPALDGDFAEFVSIVSQENMNELAPDGNGLAFLEKYIRIEEENPIDIETLWKQLPETRIERIEQTNHQCLAYLFKSLHSDTYLIIWDKVILKERSDFE